jgi:ABC-type lipoprotein release transport system permease subunit
MALRKLWVLAYRDLWRNRRRTLLTMIAVALGLALLMVMNGFIAGILDDSIQNSIRLNTGHVQLRAASYNEEELSLRRTELLSEPTSLAERAALVPGVQAATPVLWAGVIAATPADSAGLRLYGIDPASPIYEPIRSAMITGEFLAADDRSGILIGERLAASLNTGVGGRVALTVVDADGRADEGIFVVRGLFATGIPSYDDGAVLMPLDRAQAFTSSPRRASAVIILLHDAADTAGVAALLSAPGLAVRTWQDLNRLLLEGMQTGMAFYVILDAIVIMIVAVILANTLLMSVFERIREMGILSALGMKGRQLMLMFLLEAAILGVFGLAIGAVIGSLGVGYLATVGIPIGAAASVGGSGIALSSSVYARFVPDLFAAIALAMLLIILVAALYPAWYAARLEPVAALRG